MKLAVTGATGFLGSHLVDVLLARGHTLRAVVRDPSRADELKARGLELAKADLADTAAMTEAFRGVDAVIDNAALSTRDTMPWSAFVEANITGSENVTRAVADAGVKRIVKISTIAVHRVWPLISNSHESALLADAYLPLSVSFLTTSPKYALSKGRGEKRSWEIAQERGLQLTAIRPGPIYGSRDHKFTDMYRRLAGRSVAILPTSKIPHVHAGDVAIAAAGALDNPDSIGRSYTVTGESASMADFLRIWCEQTGKGPRIVRIPVPLGVWFDDSAAARDLGYRPRSLVEGIREVLSR